MKKGETRHWTLALVLSALILTVGLLFFGAGQRAAAAQEGARAGTGLDASPQASLPYGTFVDLTAGAPVTLDPHWGYDTASWRVVYQVYETLLMQEREDAAAYIPLLSTGWNIAPDGRTYTFDVRSGVTFHEGGTLQPHDVAYSFWRGLLQDRGSGPMWLLLDPLLDVYDVDDLPGDDLAICQAVKGAVTFDDGAGTVTFHLTKAFAPFLDILSIPASAALDQEWMAANGDWNGDCATWRAYHDPAVADSLLYDQMNGTGPFRFDHWTGGEVGLVRYAGYWRQQPAWEGGPSGPAALETVLIVDEPDWATRRDMLLGGQADTIYVPATTAAELDPFLWGIYEGIEDRDPTLVDPEDGILRLFQDLPTSSQNPLLFCYAVNSDTNPYIGSGVLDGDGIPPDFFADLHVRKAFNYALDWSAVITDVYGGQAFRSRGPIPRGMLGYDPAQPVYAYSPTLAAQELQQAWGGQAWTQGFSLTVAYNEGNLTRQRIAEVLAQ
ncbi:MAG: ABC transporter substrate-binding protein, partial [Anaerolineae bacterium]